tara:strand:- start:117 stop:380 length:264 start_codon:yes stop_codon:yes gene_type:complete
MNSEYHAFFSKKQLNILKMIPSLNFKNNNKITTLTNFYKLKNKNELVETTVVYDIIDFPTIKSCNIMFDDSIYLGIVDKWIKIGQTI